MIRRILATLATMLVVGVAQAATVTAGVSISSTAGSPNTSAGFTPDADDLLVALLHAANSASDPGTISTSTGITFTQATRCATGANSSAIYIFVADALATNVSMTVTWNPGSATNGVSVGVMRVAGMTRTGSDAIKQVSSCNAVAAASAPSTTFGASVLTENPTLMIAGNTSNTASLTPPTNWTEAYDLGYNTPTTGTEIAFRNSGFTGTTVTWGNNSATDSDSIGIELDTSALPGGSPDWDTQIAVSAQTNDDYDLGYDANADADDIFVAAYPDGTAEQTGANISAGTGAHGTATEASTGSSDSINLVVTDNPPFYKYQIQGVLKEDGGNYSSVVTLNDEVLDVPAGFTRTTCTSIDATSPLVGTSVAAGDTGTLDATTDPSGYAVTLDADCSISYAAGGDLSLQEIYGYFYDESSPQNYEFNFVFNNLPPLIIEGFPQGLYPVADGAWSLNGETGVLTGPGIDLSLYALDPEFGDVDFAITAGTLPDGNCGPFEFTTTATDEHGADIEVPSTISIGTTVPDVVTGGVDEATAVAAIEAQNAAEGCLLTAVAGNPRYSSSVALGDVISTSPASGSLVEPDAAITYVLSLGPNEGNVTKGLGSSIRARKVPQGMRVTL